MAIQFHLLGPLEVLRNGAAVQLTSTKLRTLLAVLLVHRNEVVSVDRLVDALWRDDPPATAPGVLQTYVSQLRKAIDPGGARGAHPRVLVTVEPGYRLDVAADQVDAECFDRLLAEGRAAAEAGQPGVAAQLLREGLALWRGPALADVADEEPLHTEALRLDELRTVAIEQRIDADITLGRHGELVGELTQLVSSYPLRERLWAQLMVCLYREGRQAEALRTFQELRGRLGDELGLDPSPDLAKLERDILAQAPSLDWSPPVARSARGTATRGRATSSLPGEDESLPFVGRDDELTALRAWWDDPAAPRLALLTGEAGVGKTRLAATFAREVQRSGATVLYGRAIENAGSSYEPVLGALRQFVVTSGDDELDALGEMGTAALSRLVPEMVERRPEIAARAAAWTDIDRSWLLTAVAECFATGDGSAPVFVLDDLQWADRSALLLLSRIIGLDTGARVLGTCREPGTGTSDVSNFLAELRRDDTPVRRISLGGLSREDVVNMVGLLAGDDLSLAGRALAADLHRRTNGNSFFIRETVRHLEETGAISPADGRWASERPLDELGVPAGVKDVVDHRLSRLAPPTVELLQAAAVVGHDFDVDVVSAVTGAGETRAIAALEETLAAGLVREDRTQIDHYEFVHALVREVLLRGLSASRRVRLEWQTGEALEALRPNELDERAAELARHFAEGVAVGDAARAVRWAARAGDWALARLAYEESVRYYEVGLRCLGLVEDAAAAERVDLLIALARACIPAGEAARWRTACLEAATVARRSGDPERLARAAITRLGPLGPGEVDEEVVLLLEEAADALRQSAQTPGRQGLLAEVLARLGGYITNVRPDQSAASVREALETARQASDDRVLALALMYSTQTYALEREDHLGRLREAASIAERIDDVEVALLADSNLMAGALIWSDRDEFDRRLADYARIAEETRSPTHLLWSAVDHAGAAALDGRYREAREQYRVVLRGAGTLADPSVATTIDAGRFPVDRELGTVSPDTVRRALDANPGLLGYRPALAVALCDAGALDEAGEVLDRMLDGGADMLLSGPLHRFILSMLAETAHALCDTRAAAQLHDWLQDEPRLGEGVIVGSNTYFGAVRRCLGLLALTLGRRDEAVEHHEAALDVHERMRAQGWAARSRHDLACALLVRGGEDDHAHATRLLGEAVEAATTLGMPKLLSDVRSVQTRGDHAE